MLYLIKQSLYNLHAALWNNCKLLSGKAAMQWLCTKNTSCITKTSSRWTVQVLWKEGIYKHTQLEQLGIRFPMKTDSNYQVSCFLRSFLQLALDYSRAIKFLALGNNCKLDGASNKPVQEH